LDRARFHRITSADALTGVIAIKKSSPRSHYSHGGRFIEAALLFALKSKKAAQCRLTSEMLFVSESPQATRIEGKQNISCGRPVEDILASHLWDS
jgi:hypothetical protein